MQLKPLTVAVIALKDNAIIILEALIAYKGKRLLLQLIFILCGKQKEYNVAS